MRKTLIFLGLVMFATTVWGFEPGIILREDLSLKAGPTMPGEKLSMVWVESYIYPKVVKSDRVVSLGVRLTSRVKAVSVTFDFNKQSVALVSDDGLQWSGAYRLPNNVGAGLHIARYKISAAKGSLQRTVDFFVAGENKQAKQNDDLFLRGLDSSRGWALTVNSPCLAIVDGKLRQLPSGEKVTGLSKVPWYKVVLANGKEGWLPASKVTEPLAEYYAWGFEAYRNGKYKEALKYYKTTVMINPKLVKGHFWLAKCYLQLNQLAAAYTAIQEALRLDERDIDSKVFANKLAHKYYVIAHKKIRAKRYHEAVAAYQKVLELKPTSIKSWIELGNSYKKLGFAAEARATWQEAFKLDPTNQELYALLNIRAPRARVARKAVKRKATQRAKLPAKPKRVAVSLKEAHQQVIAKVAKVKQLPKAAKEVPALVADDSLTIVKDKKTKKGTKVEAALKSVVALTKSLGTSVVERGWQVKKRKENFLVKFICEQGQGVVESFEWLVDVDTKRVSANNDNARLLMNRW